MTPDIHQRVPEWFGPEIALAQHKDTKANWPAWKRFLHRILVAHRCPCCKIEADRLSNKGLL